jgi:hypothetical protein
MINGISNIGVLLLLLLTGMETDLALVKRVHRTAAIASAAGIVIPFGCGYVLGEMLPDSVLLDPSRRLLTSLFLATALSVSSVKISRFTGPSSNSTNKGHRDSVCVESAHRGSNRPRPARPCTGRGNRIGRRQCPDSEPVTRHSVHEIAIRDRHHAGQDGGDGPGSEAKCDRYTAKELKHSADTRL